MPFSAGNVSVDFVSRLEGLFADLDRLVASVDSLAKREITIPVDIGPEAASRLDGIADSLDYIVSKLKNVETVVRNFFGAAVDGIEGVQEKASSAVSKLKGETEGASKGFGAAVGAVADNVGKLLSPRLLATLLGTSATLALMVQSGFDLTKVFTIFASTTTDGITRLDSAFKQLVSDGSTGALIAVFQSLLGLAGEFLPRLFSFGTAVGAILGLTRKLADLFVGLVNRSPVNVLVQISQIVNVVSRGLFNLQIRTQRTLASFRLLTSVTVLGAAAISKMAFATTGLVGAIPLVVAGIDVVTSYFRRFQVTVVARIFKLRARFGDGRAQLMLFILSLRELAPALSQIGRIALALAPVLEKTFGAEPAQFVKRMQEQFRALLALLRSLQTSLEAFSKIIEQKLPSATRKFRGLREEIEKADKKKPRSPRDKDSGSSRTSKREIDKEADTLVSRFGQATKSALALRVGFFRNIISRFTIGALLTGGPELASQAAGFASAITDKLSAVFGGIDAPTEADAKNPSPGGGGGGGGGGGVGGGGGSRKPQWGRLFFALYQLARLSQGAFLGPFTEAMAKVGAAIAPIINNLFVPLALGTAALPALSRLALPAAKAIVGGFADGFKTFSKAFVQASGVKDRVKELKAKAVGAAKDSLKQLSSVRLPVVFSLGRAVGNILLAGLFASIGNSAKVKDQFDRLAKNINRSGLGPLTRRLAVEAGRFSGLFVRDLFQVPAATVRGLFERLYVGLTPGFEDLRSLLLDELGRVSSTLKSGSMRAFEALKSGFTTTSDVLRASGITILRSLDTFVTEFNNLDVSVPRRVFQGIGVSVEFLTRAYAEAAPKVTQRARAIAQGVKALGFELSNFGTTVRLVGGLLAQKASARFFGFVQGVRSLGQEVANFGTTVRLVGGLLAQRIQREGLAAVLKSLVTESLGSLGTLPRGIKRIFDSVLRTVRSFRESLGKSGIVGVFRRIATGISSFVSSSARGIGRAFRGAVSDGIGASAFRGDAKNRDRDLLEPVRPGFASREENLQARQRELAAELAASTTELEKVKLEAAELAQALEAEKGILSKIAEAQTKLAQATGALQEGLEEVEVPIRALERGRGSVKALADKVASTITALSGLEGVNNPKANQDRQKLQKILAEQVTAFGRGRAALAPSYTKVVEALIGFSEEAQQAAENFPGLKPIVDRLDTALQDTIRGYDKQRTASEQASALFRRIAAGGAEGSKTRPLASAFEELGTSAEAALAMLDAAFSDTSSQKFGRGLVEASQAIVRFQSEAMETGGALSEASSNIQGLQETAALLRERLVQAVGPEGLPAVLAKAGNFSEILAQAESAERRVAEAQRRRETLLSRLRAVEGNLLSAEEKAAEEASTLAEAETDELTAALRLFSKNLGTAAKTAQTVATAQTNILEGIELQETATRKVIESADQVATAQIKLARTQLEEAAVRQKVVDAEAKQTQAPSLGDQRLIGNLLRTLLQGGAALNPRATGSNRFDQGLATQGFEEALKSGLFSTSIGEKFRGSDLIQPLVNQVAKVADAGGDVNDIFLTILSTIDSAGDRAADLFDIISATAVRLRGREGVQGLLETQKFGKVLGERFGADVTKAANIVAAFLGFAGAARLEGGSKSANSPLGVFQSLNRLLSNNSDIKKKLGPELFNKIRASLAQVLVQGLGTGQSSAEIAARIKDTLTMALKGTRVSLSDFLQDSPGDLEQSVEKVIGGIRDTMMSLTDGFEGDDKPVKQMLTGILKSLNKFGETAAQEVLRGNGQSALQRAFVRLFKPVERDLRHRSPPEGFLGDIERSFALAGGTIANELLKGSSALRDGVRSLFTEGFAGIFQLATTLVVVPFRTATSLIASGFENVGNALPRVFGKAGGLAGAVLGSRLVRATVAAVSGIGLFSPTGLLSLLLPPKAVKFVFATVFRFGGQLLGALTRLVGAAFKLLGTFVGALFAGLEKTVTRISGFVVTASKDLKELGLEAKKAGTSVQEIQTIQRAFRRFNVETTESAQAAVILRQNIVQAEREGVGPMAEALERAGIRASDLRDGSLSLSDAFLQVADSISRSREGTEEYQQLLELVGGNMTNLKAAFTDVNALIEAFADARDSVVVDERDVAVANRIAAIERKMQAVIQDARTLFFRGLRPVIEGFADLFDNNSAQFFKVLLAGAESAGKLLANLLTRFARFFREITKDRQIFEREARAFFEFLGQKGKELGSKALAGALTLAGQFVKRLLPVITAFLKQFQKALAPILVTSITGGISGALQFGLSAGARLGNALRKGLGFSEVDIGGVRDINSKIDSASTELINILTGTDKGLEGLFDLEAILKLLKETEESGAKAADVVLEKAPAVRKLITGISEDFGTAFDEVAESFGAIEKEGEPSQKFLRSLRDRFLESASAARTNLQALTSLTRVLTELDDAIGTVSVSFSGGGLREGSRLINQTLQAVVTVEGRLGSIFSQVESLISRSTSDASRREALESLFGPFTKEELTDALRFAQDRADQQIEQVLLPRLRSAREGVVQGLRAALLGEADIDEVRADLVRATQDLSAIGFQLGQALGLDENRAAQLFGGLRLQLVGLLRGVDEALKGTQARITAIEAATQGVADFTSGWGQQLLRLGPPTEQLLARQEKLLAIVSDELLVLDQLFAVRNSANEAERSRFNTQRAVVLEVARGLGIERDISELLDRRAAAFDEMADQAGDLQFAEAEIRATAEDIAFIFERQASALRDQAATLLRIQDRLAPIQALDSALGSLLSASGGLGEFLNPVSLQAEKIALEMQRTAVEVQQILQQRPELLGFVEEWLGTTTSLETVAGDIEKRFSMILKTVREIAALQRAEQLFRRFADNIRSAIESNPFQSRVNPFRLARIEAGGLALQLKAAAMESKAILESLSPERLRGLAKLLSDAGAVGFEGIDIDTANPSSLVNRIGEATRKSIEQQLANINLRPLVDLINSSFSNTVASSISSVLKGLADGTILEAARTARETARAAGAEFSTVLFVVSRLGQSIFEGALNSFFERFQTQLQDAITKGLTDAFTSAAVNGSIDELSASMQNAIGLAASGLLAVLGLVLSRLQTEVQTTQDTIDSAIQSTEAVRGVISGSTQVAISEVSDSLRDANAPVVTRLDIIIGLIQRATGLSDGAPSPLAAAAAAAL